MWDGSAGYSGRIACHYVACRPRYPDGLYRYLASLTPWRECAWDHGTGNGQAAVGLARHFRRVVATDVAAEQVALAASAPNISYRAVAGAASGLAAGSTDLVTAAQAAHWFDLPGFYAEVDRVTRPGGLVAVWCYRIPEVAQEVDSLVAGLYDAGCLARYWPAQRSAVDSGYRDLPFPYRELDPPAFAITESWAWPRFEAYLRTWPAVCDSAGDSQARAFADSQLSALSGAWGNPSAERTVRWRLCLRVGRVEG